MLQDLRYGIRLMTRRPGFAAVAVATLALGIGTTTAIFAVTDRVLLRPVPYADPGTLAVVWETPPNHPCRSCMPRRRTFTSASAGRAASMQWARSSGAT